MELGYPEGGTRGAVVGRGGGGDEVGSRVEREGVDDEEEEEEGKEEEEEEEEKKERN